MTASVVDVGSRFSAGRCVLVYLGILPCSPASTLLEKIHLETAIADGVDASTDVVFVPRELEGLPYEYAALRHRLGNVPIVACDSEDEAAEILSLSGVSPRNGVPSRLDRIRREHEDISPQAWTRALVLAGRTLNGAALEWLAVRRSPGMPSDIGESKARTREYRTSGIMKTAGQWIDRNQASLWAEEVWNSRSRLGQWRELHCRYPDFVVRHPPRSIGIVLATRRRENLLGAVRQVASQTWPALSLTVMAHGIQLSMRDRDVVRGCWAESRPAEDLQIVELDASHVFGSVLRVGFSSTNGELITKWDDDDLYASSHIEELELLQRLSGAGLVGKAAEFVRLEQSQLLVRRFPRGAYTHHADIAGGTLMLTDDFVVQFPFDRIRRSVDQSLISRVIDAGMLPFRGPGFGYCLVRSSGDHTWRASDSYFLSQAVAVYPFDEPAWDATHDFESAI